jgi:hypothetical protein
MVQDVGNRVTPRHLATEPPSSWQPWPMSEAKLAKRPISGQAQCAQHALQMHIIAFPSFWGMGASTYCLNGSESHTTGHWAMIIADWLC